MVKRQKEKQYLSSREQKAYGKSRSNTANTDQNGVVQKSLPFSCCALTLVPFETPVCTLFEFHPSHATTQKSNHKYGILFDNAALTEFVWKHKRDPVSGTKLVSSQIIQLHMDRDSQTGDWQCPVLTKAFSDNTKIVAILNKSKTEAHVYSYEAYHELNVKPKSYVDLTTGQKFHPKKDVLILNDPANQEFQKTVRDVSNFWHIQNAKTKTNTANKNNNNSNSNIRKSVTATRVMEEIEKNKKKKQEEELKKQKAKEAAAAAEAAKTNKDKPGSFVYEVPGSNLPFVIPTEDVTGVQYTSGSAALGLTSTASVVSSSKNESRAATPKEILNSRFRLMRSWKGKKGYVNLVVEICRQHQAPLRLPLLLELHCDICPRTCTNFLGLCAQQKYNGSIFHRLIFDFMIQGGGEKLKQTSNKTDNESTTTTKSKDSCLWGPGESFADEFDQRLKHTEGGGILAMANAGPHTNKQQFYITLGRACPHLDRKHSVFGSVAKGMEEFRKALEQQVTTDAKDRPVLEHLDTTNGETTVTHAVVVIVATEILEDPAKKARDSEDKRLTELHNLREAKRNKRKRLVDGGNMGDTKSKESKHKKKSESSTMGVGKYLSKAFSKPTDETAAATISEKPAVGFGKSTSDIGLPEIIPPVKQKKPKKTKFGDFSSW